MTAPAAMAARIIRTDKRIVTELRNAGALSATSAITLEASGLRTRRISRLTGAGVLISVGDGRHYLDELAWTAYQEARRTRMLIAIGVVVVVFAIGIWIGFFRV